MTLSGWRRADGYAGLEPQRRLDYTELPTLQVAGVRWVKRADTTDRIEGLTPLDDRWHEVPGPLPKVRLVGRARQSDHPSRDLRRIEIRGTALTEIPLGLPGTADGWAKLMAARTKGRNGNGNRRRDGGNGYGGNGGNGNGYGGNGGGNGYGNDGGGGGYNNDDIPF